ncbi:phosphatidylinositol kinase [Streptomyces tateyamensis]|uniref:Phosphatidylinositol kinase n=1 Tax=Streptomyces tateyamensis TaxID=565073 RepID=A0A2V4N3C9_9ACTN|nr:SCO1664 family protein [Streptomyces tateyamensis]PYC77246.1 phosphatidylinositol kinase [Streptomyces tateyamensis]
MAADVPTALELLRAGRLTVLGQLTDASNAALYCSVELAGLSAACVYKPVRGERPLWDFPDGTLAGREVAAYEVSAATGWALVPPTVLREGPFGPGMAQIWVEPDPQAVPLLSLQSLTGPEPGWLPIVAAELDQGRRALLVHADDERLRRLAVLDAVLNNADRKGGHLLQAADGRIYGIDHGVTFNTEGKLRTLLWGWAGEPLTEEARLMLGGLADQLAGPLGELLSAHLTAAELAALSDRVAELRRTATHPQPSQEWPAIPWPPV